MPSVRVLKKSQKLSSLPKSKARLTIAKDVIAALHLKAIEATKGMYIELIDRKGETLMNHAAVLKNKPFESLIAKAKQCEACALGSLFVCHVARFNEFRTGDLTEEGEFLPSQTEILPQTLERYFPIEQLALIESCFEGEPSSAYSHTFDRYGAVWSTHSELGKLWVSKWFDPHDRMLAIMANIIKHGGKFCPKDMDIELPKPPKPKKKKKGGKK